MRIKPVRTIVSLLLVTLVCGLVCASVWFYNTAQNTASTTSHGEHFRDLPIQKLQMSHNEHSFQIRHVNLTKERVIDGEVPARDDLKLRYAQNSQLKQSQSNHLRDINLLNNRRYNQKFDVRSNPSDQLFQSDIESVFYAKKFPFQSAFTFPQPDAVRTIDEIHRTVWLHDLRVFLSNLSTTTQLSLVTSNSKYTDVLLNWLISYSVRCELPLENVLVLSLDESLHYMLVRRGINSVYLPLSGLLNPRANFSTAFDQVMMTRLSVMRIINHFGFDVVNYDTDAVLLKDPQPLYDELRNDDIIGSVGKIPFDLIEDWGITICIGVVLVRSNHKTEDYWNSMPGVCKESFDDQEKLNCGLKALDIHWKNNDSNYQNTTVFGITQSSYVRVSILPYKHICRQLTCEAELRNTFYIWHKGGSRKRRDKLVGAREGQTWFLRYKWERIENVFTGRRWLDSIAYYTVTRT